MNENKITFGITSKGKLSVIHKHYEFVRHRQYVNGNIEWRCKRYQNNKCPARLTTNNDELVSKKDPQHNHDSSKESILARQAVAEMKDKITEVSTSTSSVISSVSTQLDPNTLTALPKKISLQRTLLRKRQKLQAYSNSEFSQTSPTGMALNVPVPAEFSDNGMIFYNTDSRSNQVPSMSLNEVVNCLELSMT